jgi:Uma2 family endonuclease
MDFSIKTPITIDDLVNMDEDQWIEVSNGEIVETDMSAASYLHAIINDNVYGLLRTYVKSKHLGRVFGDGLTFVLNVDSKGIQYARIPDCSFVRHDNTKPDFDITGFFIGAPDLAIEVISPSETAEIIQAKIRDYLRFGTEQVWVLYPTTKTVHVYHSATLKTVQIYEASDTLVASSLFPDLELSVADFFVLDDE